MDKSQAKKKRTTPIRKVSKKVEIASAPTDFRLEWLEPFQGSLKELSRENYEKLKRQILEHGFVDPFVVWHDTEDKKYYLLDGHQRLNTLNKMRDEGYVLPPNFPVNMVEGKSKKEAKEILLALSSQYGEMTGEGLYEYLSEADITPIECFTDFNFDIINNDKFLEEFFVEQAEEQKQKERLCPNCGEPI